MLGAVAEGELSGRMAIRNRGPSDLLKIARRLAREYQNISPRHVIRVDSPLSGLLGDWDEARMERVVSNLISNGVKYSPQGGDVTINVDREERDGELFATLSVTDEGMGIPPGEVDRVFEPYFRASNVARTVSGTGVGLTGTRQIIEQHGGTISVESTFGESTVFTVCLPVIREFAEAARGLRVSMNGRVIHNPQHDLARTHCRHGHPDVPSPARRQTTAR